MATVEFETEPGKMTTDFEVELATYERLKPALLATSEGKYAVILGHELLAVCETLHDALEAGYRSAEPPFLMKRIERHQLVISFDRPSLRSVE